MLPNTNANIDMNTSKEKDNNVTSPGPDPEISVEELVEDAMDEDNSGSSIYHPANTDSLVSRLTDDRGFNISTNSSYLSVVSGLDQDSSFLQHELQKCHGIKVQLEFSEDFDGDQDDLILDSPLEMDILWANPKFLQDDVEGGRQIYIPVDASEDSANELKENPLKKSQKKRKRKTVSKSSSGREEHTSSLKITSSAAPNLTSSCKEESDNGEAAEEEMSEGSEEAESWTDHDGDGTVEDPPATSSQVASSVSEEDNSSAVTTEGESESSEYDVDFMGRWDIFWPIMSRSERKMVGAPSDVDINGIESGSFIVSPSEMDEDKQRNHDDNGSPKRNNAEIQELPEETPVTLRDAGIHDLGGEAKQPPAEIKMESAGADDIQ